MIYILWGMLSCFAFFSLPLFFSFSFNFILFIKSLDQRMFVFNACILVEVLCTFWTWGFRWLSVCCVEMYACKVLAWTTQTCRPGTYGCALLLICVNAHCSPWFQQLREGIRYLNLLFGTKLEELRLCECYLWLTQCYLMVKCKCPILSSSVTDVTVT